MTDVKGWLHLRGGAARVRRGSGLLAVLLAGAERVLDTPAKRADAIERWRGAQETARRHRIQQIRTRTERYESDWQAPSSRAVQREVEAAFARVREAANGGRRQDLGDVGDDQGLGLEPSEQELAELRAAAAGELMQGGTTLIRSLSPEPAALVRP
ncbi:hypothetical protein [Streptomyces sp. CC224B]|uniref:hypothetical protein n=1 Tax=Streptomyces sp. CC224B TaxID=3044571 RepID=UPI0024A95DDD|nr:hypothetical protein [Streptomyces sp. CC224B]